MSKKIKINKGGKILLVLMCIGALWGAKWYFLDSSGAVLGKGHDKNGAVIIDAVAVALPNAPKDQRGENVQFSGLPVSQISTDSRVMNSIPMKAKIMAWNSQMGIILANGGGQTTRGSLMEKHGVNLTIERLDDCGQMQSELVKFATDYKRNPSTARGTNFIAIMGDGAPSWLAGVNSQLRRLGPEYIAEIIYSCGRSLGEDQFMAPPSVKTNPQSARGMTCATVIRDGDWNIVVKWASDNNIPVNTDEGTYNPNAINFIAVSENTDASKKYNAGYTEVRDEVRVSGGKTIRTGNRVKVKVDMVSVWTPGDVVVAEGKGGLVRIVSTKEYSAQMPNVFIGIKKWNSDHRKEVESLIAAASEGGDQVKTFSESLNKAGELSAKIYDEQNGEYWVKYYNGVTQYDKQGNQVELGGSRVNNLADNMALFGLNGGPNVYASVYKVFGDIASKLYPELIPSYPSINDILNTSYIENVARKTASSTIIEADHTEYSTETNNLTTVSKRAWSIKFETGSANFTRATLNTLRELNDQLTIAQGLRISIEGHTDASGSDAVNIPLSQRRAEAVRTWLRNLSPNSYPAQRFISVVGKGSREPIPGAGNSQNRRVEVTLSN